MDNWNDGAYLSHHGIKGMKWGVRRFQNEDGSLTLAGLKRYANNLDLDDTQRKLNKADGMIKVVKKQREEREHKEYEEKIKTDLKNMSDKELQQIVNRLNMEERYTQVMKSREKDRGQSEAMKWLEAAGTAVTVAGSAVSVAIAFKQAMDLAKK